MPMEKLKNAEALAILMRIVDGHQDEDDVEYRADRYYDKANTRLWFIRFGELYDKE